MVSMSTAGAGVAGIAGSSGGSAVCSEQDTMSALSSGEESSADAEGEGADSALSEQRALVEYVRRVWGAEPAPEHSYSRTRAPCWGECGGRGAGRRPELRRLGGGRVPRCVYCSPAPHRDRGLLDVETVTTPAPAPSGLLQGGGDVDEDPDDDPGADDDPDEERLRAAGRDARDVLLVLQDARLERLAGAAGWRGRGARRLRRLLASRWAGGGATRLLDTVTALCSPPARRLLSALLPELRRRARPAARLLPPVPLVPIVPPAPRAPRPTARAPRVLWLPSGCTRLDDRWERLLRPLLPFERVAPLSGGPSGAERWCGAAVEACRTAVRTRGGPGTVIGGAGAGALLALRTCGPCPVLALGPPLSVVQLEPRGCAPCPVRALVVLGEAGARSSWAAACSWAEGVRTTLLLVGGADDQLRLPSRRQARAALPQKALDAALAEECARWAVRSVREPSLSPPPQPAPPPPSARSSGVRGVGVSVRGVGAGAGTGASAGGHSAVDILHMPIVFADDDVQLLPPDKVDKVDKADKANTGTLRKVLIAKRGRRSQPASRV